MKKIKQILVLTVMLVLVQACNKDDTPKTPDPDPIGNPDPDPTPENRPPGMFELLEVPNAESEVSLKPTFRWSTSADPDGDAIDYDLLLGTADDDQETIAANLRTATYRIDENLARLTDYYWKVIAKDAKGLETASQTFSFATRGVNNPSLPGNPSPSFSPRNLHTVTFYRDKLWLFGGADEDNILADLWSSKDGITWNPEEYVYDLPLRGHTALVLNDTLWLLGGRYKKETDSRTKGMYAPLIEDNLVYDSFFSPWPERELHTSAVFKDRAWVLGGIDNDDQPLNDVWSTAEVSKWRGAGTHPPATWPARYGHSTVVFDDKLWVIGGYDGANYLNDVWYTDGNESSSGELLWIEVIQEKAFPKRLSHQSVVFDDKIWIFGGGDGSALSDIWYSEDGANWVPFFGSMNFTGRVRPTVTVFEDKMFMIGG
ncbi:hypothetical protein N9954_08590, partial [Maribacter sp.]|nr:hypothetical protein [Maribacter sp.]